MGFIELIAGLQGSSVALIFSLSRSTNASTQNVKGVIHTFCREQTEMSVMVVLRGEPECALHLLHRTMRRVMSSVNPITAGYVTRYHYGTLDHRL